MPIFLLTVSAVLLLCVALQRLSARLGIPALLAFILLGMLFGSDGAVRIPFDNYAMAEQISSVALIFIMFYGGYGTSWREARGVAAPALLLSSLGVVLTAGLVGVFCHVALGFPWLESFLTGSVIGSTDAASVFSILRSRRLNLRDGTASLLEVESGSNDPFAYMLTMVFLSAMKGTATGGGVALMLAAQLLVGIGMGAAIAFVGVWLLRRVHFKSPGLDGVCVAAVALLAYAAPAALGGNGYLSTYIVGIALGNAGLSHQKTLVPFFDGVTGMLQMVLFFLLGLLSFPSRLPQVVLPALLIALFLTFVARPLAVFALMAPFRASLRQKLVVAWAGLRGAASIVFAVMAVMAADTQNDLFHIVFCIVLFSILLQGSLLPMISRRMKMIDDSGDVMKTFSDYSAEMPVRFVQFVMPEAHDWCGKSVREVTLPPDTLLALLCRGGEKLVPNGDTRLLPGDAVILCARSPEQMEGVQLTEEPLPAGSSAIGQSLSELPRQEGALVILILRGQRIVIPRGDTVLREGDVLVINRG